MPYLTILFLAGACRGRAGEGGWKGGAEGYGRSQAIMRKKSLIFQ
jgi:hypothetical protein